MDSSGQAGRGIISLWKENKRLPCESLPYVPQVVQKLAGTAEGMGWSDVSIHVVLGFHKESFSSVKIFTQVSLCSTNRQVYQYISFLVLGSKRLEEQVALRITSIHLVTRLQQQNTGNYTHVLSGKAGFHTDDQLKDVLFCLYFNDLNIKTAFLD